MQFKRSTSYFCFENNLPNPKMVYSEQLIMGYRDSTAQLNQVDHFK